MIAQRFWLPSVTSQFVICPIPFHLDTYKGCVHGCCYCFGRDLVNWTRRTRSLLFAELEANSPRQLSGWMQRVYGRRRNFRHAATVFINERVPLKIGAICDPCPPVENELHITEETLRVLADYDYPVQVQTKNPEILRQVLQRIGPGHNIVVSVTVISLDTKWTRRVEPGAPPPQSRLEAIKGITDGLGYPVMVKVQPAVFPRVLRELPDLVAAIAKAGCWAFNTEGLKVKIAMPQNEQRIFGALGRTVRQEYRDTVGHREGSDWVLKDEFKRQYIDLAVGLAKLYGLKYFSADNSPLGLGDGYECCGTERLRDYNVFAYNRRSQAFGMMQRSPLGECAVRFVRSIRMRSFRTIHDAVDDQLEGS
jgi:DNA repair photolyase